jgi:hypothetical protein
MKLQKAMLGMLLIVPIGMKAGLPTLETALARAKLLVGFEQTLNRPVYGVGAINRGVLSLVHPDGNITQNTLAGLAPSSTRWQDEATGILGSILRTSRGQVFVSWMNQGTAVVSLPNGTMLQRILLSDGVAKTDPAQLALMPTDIANTLRQAELSAQQQHKNIWAEKQ